MASRDFGGLVAELFAGLQRSLTAEHERLCGERGRALQRSLDTLTKENRELREQVSKAIAGRAPDVPARDQEGPTRVQAAPAALAAAQASQAGPRVAPRPPSPGRPRTPALPSRGGGVPAALPALVETAGGCEVAAEETAVPVQEGSPILGNNRRGQPLRSDASCCIMGGDGREVSIPDGSGLKKAGLSMPSCVQGGHTPGDAPAQHFLAPGSAVSTAPSEGSPDDMEGTVTSASEAIAPASTSSASECAARTRTLGANAEVPCQGDTRSPCLAPAEPQTLASPSLHAAESPHGDPCGEQAVPSSQPQPVAAAASDADRCGEVDRVCCHASAAEPPPRAAICAEATMLGASSEAEAKAVTSVAPAKVSANMGPEGSCGGNREEAQEDHTAEGSATKPVSMGARDAWRAALPSQAPTAQVDSYLTICAAVAGPVGPGAKPTGQANEVSRPAAGPGCAAGREPAQVHPYLTMCSEPLALDSPARGQTPSTPRSRGSSPSGRGTPGEGEAAKQRVQAPEVKGSVVAELRKARLAFARHRSPGSQPLPRPAPAIPRQ